MPVLLVVLTVLAFGSVPTEAAAQSVTAFKTGERTTGATKQCYYAFGGKEYTRTVESYQLCPLSISVPSTPTSGSPSPRPTPPRASTVTAFKTGENRTGSTKQCFYEFGGKRYTTTVESYELCPLSIQVPSGTR